jgi:hypothetical protein
MASYAVARERLSRAQPSESFRPQASGHWQGEFPLPDPVAEYFAKFGPVDVWIPGYGNPYFLPSLAQLWSFQAGYRYHPDTRNRFCDWDDDWLVVADEGGDPFILSRASHHVLHAYHGAGVWEPIVLFGDLAQMATIFAIIGDIVASAGLLLTDDASIMLPRYLDEAQSRIAEYLHSIERAAVILQRLGWT